MKHSGCFKNVTVILVIVLGGIAVRAQGTVTERLLPVAAATPAPFEASAFAGLTPGPDGRLYGVTYSGGSADQGILYSIDTAVNGIVTHHNFTGGPDGGVPYDELVFDSTSGKFYGTTSDGGSSDLGTVFSYVPGANSITTIRSDFNGFRQAQGPLTISAGYIFGSLGRGGATQGGAVFRMAIDGSDFAILHEFESFSALPQALLLTPDGWLYGVTIYGAVACPTQPTYGCGTIFRLRRVLPGDTNVSFQTLFQFQYYRSDPCPPGDPWCVPSAPVAHNHPQRTLILGSDGWIYGQTFQRNFKFNPGNIDPGATFQFIGGFTGGVSLTTIEGNDGRLYIADYGGGPEGAGQVFSMNKDGSDKLVLRNFTFNGGLRAYGPYGRLFRDSSGIIYGTTEYTNAQPFGGTVYSVGPAPPLTGKIVYQSRPGSGIDVMSMNADGSNKQTLTPGDDGFDYDPSLSGDGTKIVFISRRDGDDDVYVMNSDGSGQAAVTVNDDTEITPAFSPDGTKIVFASSRDGNFEIYIMNADGTNQTRLTTNAARDDEPSFSPDGSKIVFTSHRDGMPEIYVMNADGTDQTRLTTNTVNDSTPAYSPDGTKIAFTSFRNGNAEIYIMNANGSSQTRVTDHPSTDTHPSFSPDGTQIAFATNRDGAGSPGLEIYVMHVSGANPVRYTTAPDEDSSPWWGGTGGPPPPPKPSAKVSIAGGNLLIGSPGEGLILRSPNGTTCIKIGIDNAGAMTTQVIACP